MKPVARTSIVMGIRGSRPRAFAWRRKVLRVGFRFCEKGSQIALVSGLLGSRTCGRAVPARRDAARFSGVRSTRSGGGVQQRTGPPPALVEEPGVRERDGPGSWPSSCFDHEVTRRALPAPEPSTGRGRIDSHDAGRALHVPSGVHQHVSQCVPHLGRCLQHHAVIPVLQDRSRAREHAIHCTRETRAQCIHPAPQRVRILRLHQQVDVIRLDRVVREPEVPPITGLRPGPFELSYELHGSQGRHTIAHLQGDVAGMPGSQSGSAEVRNAGPHLGLSPSPGPLPAPPGVSQASLVAHTAGRS